MTKQDEGGTLLKFRCLLRGRWLIEQDYRELKEEPGLDYFEGRGWPGRHHRVTLVTLAFAFLRSEQLRFKKNVTYQLADDPGPPPGGADSDDGSMSVVPNVGCMHIQSQLNDHCRSHGSTFRRWFRRVGWHSADGLPHFAAPVGLMSSTVAKAGPRTRPFFPPEDPMATVSI